MSEHKAIFKSASVIGIFTVVSRITGFLRDVLMANIFGTSFYAQAFFVAFKIPNLFRNAIGEGAGNAAFVPVFCECLAQKKRSDFLKLANTVLLLVAGLAALISLMGVVFSPLIIRLIAPGFLENFSQFELTIQLTRILFPYLILVALSACLASVANAQNSFAVPASSSAVFNIVLILCMIMIAGMSSGRAIYFLCIGVLLAGVFQVCVQIPPLLKTGIGLSAGIYTDFFRRDSVRKIARLAGPRVVGASVYQMNVFVDTIFASLALFVGQGAIAAIYYANRIIQLPFAIIGIAFANAALPAMSASSSCGDMARFRKTLVFSMKATFLGILPAMIGILVLSAPLVEVIFQRGHFDAYSAAITSRAVFFYAFGLIAYTGTRLLSSAFYALQDTVTPVKISFAAFLVNIVLNALFIFVFRFGIAGLALASVFSAIMNFVFLYVILAKKTGFHFSGEFGVFILKAVIASLIMAVFILSLWHNSFLFLPGFIRMALVIILGILVYAAALVLLKVRELKEVLPWFRKSA
ncbi:MAG: murein biosynthesis integral membrane protein MurJ [Candidatus Omnitrophota bacterium]